VDCPGIEQLHCLLGNQPFAALRGIANRGATWNRAPNCVERRFQFAAGTGDLGGNADLFELALFEEVCAEIHEVCAGIHKVVNVVPVIIGVNVLLAHIALIDGQGSREHLCGASVATEAEVDVPGACGLCVPTAGGRRYLLSPPDKCQYR